MELRTTPQDKAHVQYRADDGQPQAIEGYAAVFYREGEPETEYELAPGYVERIMPEAFDAALEERHDARALYNHDSDNLLGRVSSGTLRLEKTAKGLRYSIPYDPEDTDHKRVLAKIKRGDLQGSSFAFDYVDKEWIKEGDREVLEVRSVKLYDCGPVTFPAYRDTSVNVRSDAVDQRKRAIEEEHLLAETERIKKRLEELLAE